MPDAPVYEAPKVGERLFQGEVLSNVVERPVTWRTDASGEGQFSFVEVTHPYVVVITQDCDLEQDFNAVKENLASPALPRVLLVEAMEYAKAELMIKGSDLKKRIRQNKDERYHYLSAVLANQDHVGTGIPSLLLDFKRYLTYPAKELYAAIDRGETKRRTRLTTPFAEHLSVRFAGYLQRIGLPIDHHRRDEAGVSAKPAQLPSAAVSPPPPERPPPRAPPMAPADPAAPAGGDAPAPGDPKPSDDTSSR